MKSSRRSFHIFRNRTSTVYGSFELDEEAAMIQILGQSSTGSRQLIYKINFAEAQSASPELAKTWAAQKIFHLIGQLTDQPDQNILNEIYSLQQKLRFIFLTLFQKLNSSTT